MNSKAKPQESPRMCQVLGVRVNEQWRIQDDDARYRVSSGGLLEYRASSADDADWKLSDVLHLSALINQPSLIIRGPIWTDEEKILIQQLPKAAVRWLSRDQGADVVDMWNEEPEDAGGYKGTMLGSVPAVLFPSLGEGDVVCIAEQPAKKD